MRSKFVLLLFGFFGLSLFVLAACSGNASPTNAPAPTQVAALPTNAPAPPTALSNSDGAPTMTKLNLNTASGDDYLKTLPNFSNRMVREFLEYRPYVSIRQFRKEIGKYVGPEQVAAWGKYVYVPVDPNQSDKETLEQLPGVNDAIAAQLIAARPFASNDAFLTKLASLVAANDAAAASAYLVNP